MLMVIKLAYNLVIGAICAAVFGAGIAGFVLVLAAALT
jgi:hypothetical protein